MAQSATVRKEDFKDENFSTGENFADLFENSAAGKVAEGSVVRGTIVGIEKDLAIIDVGLKSEGRIPLKEWLSALADRTARARIVARLARMSAGNFGWFNVVMASIDERKVWVFIQEIDNKTTRVVIQARTKGGAGDVQLASFVDKEIAVRLASNNLTPAARTAVPLTPVTRPKP